MINIFSVEIYKLFHSKSFWIIFFISTFIGVTIPLDSHGYITGYENVSSSFYNMCLLIVFPIILGGLLWGNDFLERTINNEICAGHSRLELFLCKVIVYFIGVNLVLLTYPIIKIIFNCSLSGFSVYDLFNERNLLIKTFLTSSLLAMAMSSLSIFVSLLCKDVGKTIGILVGIYFLNICILNSSDALQIKTSFSRLCPLAQMRLILYRPLILSQFKEACLVGIIMMIIVLIISYLCFKKTELK